jgi:hypothetical protein
MSKSDAASPVTLWAAFGVLPPLREDECIDC